MPAAVGTNFEDAPFVRDYREHGPTGSSENVSGVDGLAKVGSYRKVPGYALVVFVSFAKNDLLTAWRKDAVAALSAAIAVSVILGSLGWRLVAQFRLRDRTNLAVRLSEAQYRLLADHSTDVIIQLGADGRRQYVSPACERVLGYRASELLQGHPRETTHPDDWPVLRENFEEIVATGDAPPVSYRVRRKNGEYLWVETQGRRLEGGSGFIVAMRDISRRKRVEELLHEANNHLQRQVMIDGLTGIGNRRCLDLTFDKEVKRAARNENPLGMLMIDVDNFKRFNDIYGHQAGDVCLRRIAETVSSEIRRPADFAARCGGEEFAVLLPDTDEAGSTAMAERIRAAIQRLAVEHSANPGGVATVSIGVAVARPGHSATSGDDLVTNADRALYEAKARGRNCVSRAAVNDQREVFQVGLAAE